MSLMFGFALASRFAFGPCFSGTFRVFEGFEVNTAEQARETALRGIVQTFFGGSPESAVAALLDLDDELDAEALERLAGRIEDARKEGR